MTGSSTRPTPTGSPSSSTSSTTTGARATTRCGASTGGGSRARAASTSTSDDRSRTPWGDRPDYGRPEVRQYIRDNALMWLEDYRADGLALGRHRLHPRRGRRRRRPGHRPSRRLGPHAVGQRRDRRPPALEAEHRRGPAGQPGADPPHRRRRGGLRRSVGRGVRAHPAAGPDHARRRRAQHGADRRRRRLVLLGGRCACAGSSTPNPTTRWPTAGRGCPRRSGRRQADSWHSKKRSTLGAVLVFTSPGIPMLFQGQETARRPLLPRPGPGRLVAAGPLRRHRRPVPGSHHPAPQRAGHHGRVCSAEGCRCTTWTTRRR